MEKNKANYLYIILGFLLVCLCAFWGYDKLIPDKNYLTIQNGSQQVMTNVRIESSNGIVTEIGTFTPRSEFKIKLTESVNENQVSLVYTDEKNITHKEVVIGYLILAQNSNYKYKIQ